ncbi:hypothetical protein AS189_18540 [Arthrobacter alpinus]|uniref:Uncharacterized protein n=2 Tax=Arthrobacter alpinus TaxID=656366 RepID=A0A0S2M4N7_9MICC|nr:hypothetical protein AS189_18540 [Arthrobacter alpinus]
MEVNLTSGRLPKGEARRKALMLRTAIAAMDAAGQNYTPRPGIVFAALGILLALAWGVTTIVRRTVLSHWAAVSLWAGIITLGAPAYFFMSFANVNSVGDTYSDGNSEEAFAVEAPLYMVSVAAFLVVVAMVVFAMSKSTAWKKPSPAT